MGLGDRLRDFIKGNIDKELTDVTQKVRKITALMRQA